MPDVVPAAPAQPAADPVLTPSQQAVVNNDFSTFEKLERETLKGKPAPAQPAEPPAEVAKVAEPPKPEEPKGVSKRQQAINDYERRIAEQDQRIRALEAERRPAPAAPRSDPKPEPTGPAFPDYQTYLQTHPDTSLEAYIDARQDFRDAHKARLAEESQREKQLREDADARFARARASMDTALKDPEFKEKVRPLLFTLQTAEQARADGIHPGPEHFFAGAITRSDVAPKLLAHLADHPEVMERIRALDLRDPRHEQELRATFYRLEGQCLSPPALAAPAPPVATPPKTITDAPDPAHTLGSRSASAVDPSAAAVKNNDYVAFERAERERLLAAGVRR